MSWSDAELTRLLRFIQDSVSPEQIAHHLNKPLSVVMRKLNNIKNNPEVFAFESREEEEEEDRSLIDSVRAAQLGWISVDLDLTTIEVCALEALRRNHEHQLSVQTVLDVVTRICVEREWFDVQLERNIATTLFALSQLGLILSSGDRYQIKAETLKLHQSSVASRRPPAARETKIYAAPSFKI